MEAEWVRGSLCWACLGLAVVVTVAGTGQTMAGTEQRGTSSLLDRLQKEDDPELAELIRTALANHKGASEKEAREIVRRVTQGRAQILLLDQQIEEVTRKIESTPASAETRGELLRSKKELEAKRLTEMGNLREAMGIVPQLPVAKKPEESLNAWLHLNVLDQRVYVTDTLRPFRSDWAEWHFKSVGLLSDKEALDFVRTRLTDKSSRPIRIDLHHTAATSSVAAELQGRILALIKETNSQADAEVRLQPMNWVGSGTATYYLRGNEIRALYPRSVSRPDRVPRRIASGRIAPEDLEQHILWRLTYPGNVPVTVRIEYDEASANLAKQVADKVRATAKRLDCTELVEVAGPLVEPVPDTLFLGRWEAISTGEIKAIEVQPKGICLLTTREGSQAIKPGVTESCPWVPITQEVIFSVEKNQIIKTPFLEVYRGRVNAEGDLVVDRVGIYPQGSIHPRDSAPMVFKKVQ
jgi:hypothetical protein